MKVHLISTIAQLGNYTGEWERLLKGVSRSSTIFLTQEWIRTWWHSFGKGHNLSILMLFDKDHLVGIGPLAVFRDVKMGFPVKTLRLIGSGLSDHLDFYIKPELQTEGMTEMLNYIMTSLDWDIMDIVDIPEDSENVPIINDILKNNLLFYSIKQSIVCPYLRINGCSWDEFYKRQRSKSSRQDLRRRRRRLNSTGTVELKEYKSPEEVKSIFPQLFAVYQKRWDKKNLSISFTGDKERRFYMNLASEYAIIGRLDLLTLEVNGMVIAFSLSSFKDRQFTWLMTAHDPAFDKYFPGELILIHLLEKVFTAGRFNEFDFTRGDEPYKYKWTDRARNNLRIVAGNRGIRGIAPYFLLLSYVEARKTAKKSKMLRDFKLNVLGKFRAPSPTKNDTLQH